MHGDVGLMSKNRYILPRPYGQKVLKCRLSHGKMLPKEEYYEESGKVGGGCVTIFIEGSYEKLDKL